MQVEQEKLIVVSSIFFNGRYEYMILYTQPKVWIATGILIQKNKMYLLRFNNAEKSLFPPFPSSPLPAFWCCF
jgi:hypothetical protein